MNEMEARSRECGFKCGKMPGCAPLAVGYVPCQQDNRPAYENSKALVRGTLFPGLDLPLGNKVNDSAANVPAAELMSIDFAAHDLSLYLDTHPEDAEAFAVYQDLLRLSEEGTKRYVRMYGPVCKKDLAAAKQYTWLNGPWPWETETRTEG